MFFMASRLHRLGIMGMNKRNADYIMRYNPRRLYPLVDDKLTTKRLAQEAGIAVPDLYGVIEMEQQISRLDTILAGHNDFVIKPAHGSGGNGIMVIVSRRGDSFRKASGVMVSKSAVSHHISNILSGMHSLGGTPDQAIIEYRVEFDPMFSEVSYQGVPDIRTIVFQGVPVAAMVRLPTQMSDGKANLHQGAVGTGVDIVTGLTRNGVWTNRVIDIHPDTGNSIDSIQIPHWDTILLLAARCYDFAKLGYLGVDIVLDANHGPLLLELNARPGLSIQLANRIGLLKRLHAVEAIKDLPGSPVERVELAKSLFAENPAKSGIAA